MRIGSKTFSTLNTRSIVLGTVIIIACISFIFTGFGSLKLGGFGEVPQNIAARVGDQNVPMYEFSDTLGEQLDAAGIQNWASLPQGIKTTLQMQVLNGLVEQKIMLDTSKKVGWTASDGEIAALIRTIPAFQDEKTKQFSMPLFKKYLSNQRSSEVDFYDRVRNQIYAQKMKDVLFLPIDIPADLQKTLFNIYNTQFNLQYAVLDPSEEKITLAKNEKVKSFLADKANDSILKDLFAKQKEKFDTREKFKVASILVSYKGAQRASGKALERSKEEAKSTADGLLTKIYSFDDFTKLAADTNDDLTAKKNAGELGFIDSSQIDPVSIATLKTLSKDSPKSQVVDTAFGYRLFWLEDHTAEQKRSFDEVKEQLATQMVAPQVRRELENQLEKDLNNALATKNGTKVNTLLEDNGITWTNTPKSYSVSDNNLAPLGPSENLNSLIFSLKKSGDMLPQVVSFKDKKIVFKLLSLEKADATDTQKLKDFNKKYVLDQRQAFVQNTNQKLYQSYKSAGKIALNTTFNSAGQSMPQPEDLQE